MGWKVTEGFVDRNKRIPFVEWKKGKDVIVVQKGNGGLWYVFKIKLKSERSGYIETVRTIVWFQTKEEAVDYVEKNLVGGGE